MQDQSSELEYVGFWARVGASVIDSILLMALDFVLRLAVYGWDYFKATDGRLYEGLADFLVSLALPAVIVVLFWRHKQATPGKMAVRARVVDAATGNPLSVGQAIGRYLAYFLSALPLGLGFLWVAFDPKRQGWHDKLAGTVVVRSRSLRGPGAGRVPGR
ncbi:RDD family protein [Xylophilus sp. GW821-FHT01B05]